MAEAQVKLADARVFLESLDAVDVGLAFYDGDARLIHSNRLMTRAVEDGVAGSEIEKELRALVLGHARDVEGGAAEGAEPAGAAPSREVRELAVLDVTGTGRRFRVRLSYVGMDLFGHGPSYLVSLRPHAGAPDAVLMERFGLTSREVRVARMLGHGCSNARIARELGISPHTARHHTEKVLAKLGARSRSQVAPLLAGLAGP